MSRCANIMHGLCTLQHVSHYRKITRAVNIQQTFNETTYRYATVEKMKNYGKKLETLLYFVHTRLTPLHVKIHISKINICSISCMRTSYSINVIITQIKDNFHSLLIQLNAGVRKSPVILDYTIRLS